MTRAPHHWAHLGIRHFPWAYCTRCGLIRLNNEATAIVVRAGCAID